MIFQKTKLIPIFKPSLEKMVGIWQASLLALCPHGRLLEIWSNKVKRTGFLITMGYEQNDPFFLRGMAL
jgi:hypothetical protein